MKRSDISTKLVIANRWLTPLMVSAACLVGLSACGDADSSDTEPHRTVVGEQALVPFQDCDALDAYVEDVLLEQLVQSRYSDVYGFATADASGGEANNGGGDAPSDYTTTNVQEEGVDEADFVKTDGEYIYIAQGNTFTVIKSWPASETAKVAEIDLEGHAQSMFLRGDKALVMSSIYNNGTDPIFGESNNFYGGSRLTVLDLSNRAEPTIEREIDLQGWMATGRMIGGDAHMVFNAYISVPQTLWDLVWQDNGMLPEYDHNASEVEKSRVRNQGRNILRPLVHNALAQYNVLDWMPQIRDEQGIRPMYSCNELYRPAEISHLAVLSLVSLNLDDTSQPSTHTGLLADGWTVYASQDNLYVAQSSWWSWWGWGSLDLETHIHKFELGGAQDRPRYVASGNVSGWLLNQFSMSEHNGVLRVATSDTDWWWGTGEQSTNAGSNIFTFREENASLNQIGALTGLAPGEQIQAARMMGDKGYIVTFRQVDPLFTIDLSDPENPRMVGELKIPGFSSYLHPMDENHLLAVGMDGTEDGQITGMAISIFDVSDFANPRLAHKHALGESGWSWSEALWNHHAFTYHRGKLSVPAYLENYNNDESWSRFSGLIVFDIDAAEGISERGRVDHSDMAARVQCPRDYANADACEDFYTNNWYANMRRSIYIEDNLYSISSVGVKVSPLDQPASAFAEVMLVTGR